MTIDTREKALELAMSMDGLVGLDKLMAAAEMFAAFMDGSRYLTKDTLVQCVVESFYDGPADEKVLVANFSLNGKALQAEYRARAQGASAPDLVEGLRRSIAEEIAKAVLNEASASLAAALHADWSR